MSDKKMERGDYEPGGGLIVCFYISTVIAVLATAGTIWSGTPDGATLGIMLLAGLASLAFGLSYVCTVALYRLRRIDKSLARMGDD
ncbi:hypothetical protein GCM10027061_07660 [Nesterenkonia suensis]